MNAMEIQASTRPSPLQLADRMITLAQDADRAGHASTATRLVDLVYALLDGRKAH